MTTIQRLNTLGISAVRLSLFAVILLGPAFRGSDIAFAQSWTCGSGACTTSGSVGIGTTSPGANLDLIGGATIQDGITNMSSRPAFSASVLPGEVRGYSSSQGHSLDDGLLRVSAGGGTHPYVGSYIDLSGYSTVPDLDVNIVFGTSGAEKMRLNSAGNLGIGTSNPQYLLDVAGDVNFAGSVFAGPLYDTGAAVAIINGQKTAAGKASQWSILNMSQASGYSDALQFWAYDDIGCNPGGLGANRFTIADNGHVGIGTQTPQHQLQVVGTIGAEEVIVSSTGADYVFEPGYRLTPLGEVADYIKANHHLPEIPSAKEVEEMGVSIGVMQAKLLAKIEELTLHMIELEEKNSRLEAELQALGMAAK